MKTKGQTTIELLIILGVSLVALAIIYSLYVEQVNEGSLQREQASARNSIQKIINAANSLVISGAGSQKIVEVEFSDNILFDETIISGNTILIKLSNGTEIFGVADVDFAGTLRKVSGKKKINLFYDGSKIFIYYDDFEINQNSIVFSTIAGMQNSQKIILRNLSNSTIEFEIQKNFSHSSITFSTNPSENFFVSNNELKEIDLVFDISPTAFGNYSGNIIILGEVNGESVQRVINISIEVIQEFKPILITPLESTFTTFPDNNVSKNISLCNRTLNDITNISWSKSGSTEFDLSNWFELPTVNEVLKNDCVEIDLNFIIPVDAEFKLYKSDLIAQLNDVSVTTSFFANVVNPAEQYIYFSSSLDENTIDAGNYFDWNKVKINSNMNYFFGNELYDWDILKSKGIYELGDKSNASNLFDSNLVGLWHLNENFLDSSGNDNHGVLVGVENFSGGLWGTSAIEFRKNEEELILDYRVWEDGQTGSVGQFYRTGNINESHRVIDEDPFGNKVVVWETRPDGSGGGDGGWGSSELIPIDNNELYRFSLWVNKRVIGEDGRFYFGSRGNTGSSNTGVIRLSTSVLNTNPYFYISTLPPSQNAMPLGEWVLFIGHIFPQDHVGTSNHSNSGIYSVLGTKIANIGNDYKWLPETTHTFHRAFLLASLDVSTRLQFVYPRIDLVDGNEPSIEDLINGFDSYGDYIEINDIENKKTISFWYYSKENGVWNHIVDSFGTTYLNGLESSIEEFPFLVLDDKLNIGRNSTSKFFKGKIEELAIWDRELTQEEILDLYNSQNPKFLNRIVGLWHLNGNVLDSSGNDNHGISFNTTSINGLWDTNALYFNGSNSYAIIDDSFINNPSKLTISAWFKKIGEGDTYECVIHKGPNYTIGASEYWLGVDISNYLTATIGANTGVGWDAGKTNIIAELDKWYHLLATWDGSVVKVYVNGDFELEYALDDYLTTQSPTRFGASTNGLNYQFNGFIEEVIIWDRYFNQEEVLNLFEKNVRKIDLKLSVCDDENCETEINIQKINNINNNQWYDLLIGNARYLKWDINFNLVNDLEYIVPKTQSDNYIFQDINIVGFR